MLKDIVVDTCVLMHANNDQEPRQKEAAAFLTGLLNCKTDLCVDEGYHTEEAKNRSQIVSEYLKHLVPGSLGYITVVSLATAGRIKGLPRTIPAGDAKHCNRVTDKTDRVFIKVAFNSQEKVLVSHDFADLPDTLRRELVDAIDVDIITAKRALGQL